jgi:predicted permease
MLQDFRYAFRNLRRSPLFTIVALLSLALGIGANTAVFTIADQVLLRALPVKHASELLYFTSPYSGFGMGENRFSYPMFRDFRDNTAVFESVAARFQTPLSLTYNGRSERIQAELVSGAWFDTLGLGAALGRGFTPEDDRVPGGHSVVVLTYDFWRSRFNRDPSILNKVLQLNGHPMVVVGVAAPGYRGFDVGERVDVLVPTMMKAAMTPTWNGLADRRVLWLQVVARLHPGISVEAAQARLQPFYHALLRIEAESIPLRSSRAGEDFGAKPLILASAAKGVSDFRTALTAPIRILVAIVALLLLIACANVANLLLARGVGRRKEIAIRLAVGAHRGHLVRQLLAESVLLSLMGAAIGLLVAAWTVSGLLGILSNAGGMALSSALDGRVFAFTFALAVVTGIVFGIAPAWKATSPELAHVLKNEAATTTAAAGHVRMRKVLAISQVAISLVLLIGAALFTRSLRNLNRVDLGFQRDRLLSFSIDPSLNGYSPERTRQLIESVQQNVAELPGVRSAAVGVNAVVGDNVEAKAIRIPGHPAWEGEDLAPYVDAVSPGYFSTMGIPLVAGREFTPQDRAGRRRVAIVNDVFARYYFKDANPIGRQFVFARAKDAEIEIVGVVRSSKYSRVDEKATKVVYTPILQEADPGGFVVYVRAAGNPKTLFTAVRRDVAQFDAALPLTNLRTMADQVADALAAQRMMAMLSTCFAIVATLLAAIGLYGVMAYMVTGRTRELGIRVALGADRGTLLGLVMREAGMMTAIGVAVAIPMALALARLVKSELYGVGAWDPVSITAALVAVVTVALIAGYVPAARATQVKPIYVLRHQ